MKKAGLQAINIGVEAFDLNLLKQMNRKPPSHEQQERLVNYAEKKGVKIMSFYVLGIPGQTKEDVDKSLEYSRYLNSSFAQFTIAQPYPGTKFHEDVKNDVLQIKEQAYKDYYLRLNWILKRGKGLFV